MAEPEPSNRITIEGMEYEFAGFGVPKRDDIVLHEHRTGNKTAFCAVIVKGDISKQSVILRRVKPRSPFDSADGRTYKCLSGNGGHMRVVLDDCYRGGDGGHGLRLAVREANGTACVYIDPKALFDDLKAHMEAVGQGALHG